MRRINFANAFQYEKYLEAQYKRIDERLTRHENRVAGIFRSHFRSQLPAIIKIIRTEGGKLLEANRAPFSNFGKIAMLNAGMLPEKVEELQTRYLEADDRYKTIFVNISTHMAKKRKKVVPKVKRSLKHTGISAASESATQLGFKFPGFPKKTEKWLDSYTPKLAKIIDKTSLETVKREIVKGVTSGETLEGVVRRVRNVYSDMSRKRAITIARNEVSVVSFLTENDMWAKSSVKDKLIQIWRDSRDDRVRDKHLIDGERRKFGKKFSNGLRFPHDPLGDASNIINCRCWLERQIV